MHHADELPPHAVARAAEERGLDALYLPENSHVPVVRPGTRRHVEDIERLARFYDPFVALAACAATTRRMRLGTSVCLLTQRDPLATARAVASLRALAGERLVLGVAGGFIREAMENHGSPFERRWQVVRERVAAMRAAWAMLAPPTQHGCGPPVWIGSNSARVPARVAAWADGWMARPELYPGDPIADLRVACERAGRCFDSLIIARMGAPHDAEATCRAIAAGYREVVFVVAERTPCATLRRLDAIAALATRVRAVA
ncbi:MAG: LLM class flavin-dependent oxidoreductase [Gammaproteobacteria bacterium]